MQLDLFSHFLQILKGSKSPSRGRLKSLRDIPKTPVREFRKKEKSSKETYLWKGHIVQIARKRYRKRMTMTVNIEREIWVRVASTTTTKEIRGFLQDCEKWIFESLEKQERLRKLHPKKRFEEGETFPVLGRERILTIVFQKRAKKRFQLSRTHLRLYVSSQGSDSIRRDLRKAYKEMGRWYLTQRIKYWSELTQLHPTKILIRSQKTIWGSCSSQGCVSLNWKLMAAHPEVIDYVILHELCHLKHHNHSKAFWLLVFQYCPNFREHKKYLDSHQLAFEFLM